jgi:hypothetical protein
MQWVFILFLVLLLWQWISREHRRLIKITQVHASSGRAPVIVDHFACGLLDLRSRVRSGMLRFRRIELFEKVSSVTFSR